MRWVIGVASLAAVGAGLARFGAGGLRMPGASVVGAEKTGDKGKPTVKDLQGKTAVVTGATAGIGKYVTEQLAARGARVIVVARDEQRASDLIAHLPSVGDKPHTAVIGDLSQISEMKRVANEIAGAEEKLDLLINNAGAAFPTREETPDGLEKTFALNHMAYFVVTLGLLDKLKAAPSARIVVTSSRMHNHYTLDFDDLQNIKNYNAWRAYGRSKIANILFARALARRLKDSNVTVNAVHPGFVNTGLGDSDTSFMGRIMTWAKPFTAMSIEEGAKTTLYVATSDEVAHTSGAYFVKCKSEQPSAAAQNDENGERLWRICTKIAGIDAP